MNSDRLCLLAVVSKQPKKRKALIYNFFLVGPTVFYSLQTIQPAVGSPLRGCSSTNCNLLIMTAHDNVIHAASDVSQNEKVHIRVFDNGGSFEK